MISPEQLAEMKERCEKATPGPFHRTHQDWPQIIQTSHITRDVWTIASLDNHYGMNTGRNVDEDADFIAHSRTDIPLLIAEVEKFNSLYRSEGLALDLARPEVTALIIETRRLKRIIAKELSENDELGCEYVYVQALKAEIADLKFSARPECLESIKALPILEEEIMRLRAALEAIAKPTYGTEFCNSDEENNEILEQIKKNPHTINVKPLVAEVGRLRSAIRCALELLESPRTIWTHSLQRVHDLLKEALK